MSGKKLVSFFETPCLIHYRTINFRKNDLWVDQFSDSFHRDKHS